MVAGGSASAIRTRGLTRRFGEVLAVAPFDLEIPRGVTGLLGPNGSGKSTLLRMMVGIVRPDAGTAEIAGVPLRGDGTALRQRCTYAPGELALYGEMRGAEHLDFLLRGRAREAKQLARDLARELGLPLSERVRGYSHGMKRQLLFAAAMAPEVPVRILDEPNVLYSSHHLGEVELLCDRLLFLDRGRLLADESPARLASEARRAMRLSFAPDVDEVALDSAFEAVATSGAAVEINRDRLTVRVRLDTEDPRPFLCAYSVTPGAPPPAQIEYGRLSLRDLYRDLYGVEGL
jgi:ABC-2 type transport system ATP-binding protein